MADRLFRYERLIGRPELVDLLLAYPAAVAKAPLKETADLKRLRRRVTEELAKKPSNPAQLDVNLVEDVHKTFQHLPRQLLLDMRFWQWLTLEVFPDFVWARWFGGKPRDIADAVSKPSAARRFLGTGSLSGTSHNTLCRLYCAAERLHSKADGYKWSKSVFEQQDRHTAIFEREFGLYPEACLAVLKLTSGKSGKETKAISKRLNHIATTLVIDAMSEQQIRESLSP